MPDENALALPENFPVQKYDDQAFEAVATTGSFLPRLQLMTSNSKLCKSGDFPINSYALIHGDIVRDLGKTVDVAVIAWRPKAIDMNDDQVIAVYDHTDSQFKQIQARADVPNSSCMAGPEFLVFIPSLGKFATFFMGSKSARRESGNMRQLLKKFATLASKHIETKSYDWWAPSVGPCTAMLAGPDPEELLKTFEQFNNPPKTEVEKVDDTEQRAR